MSSGAQGCAPEVESALGLSLDLYDQADDGDRSATRYLMHLRPSPEAAEAELASTASNAYLVLAKHDRSLAGKAEERTLYTLAHRGEQGRNNVLSQIRLARVRFFAGEPEQACEDGERALALTSNTASAMVTQRLRDLLRESEPYRELPRVKEMRDGVRAAAVL